MNRNWKNQILAGTLAATMLMGSATLVFAGAAPDGATKASDLATTMNVSKDWTAWQKKWESVKNDWTQISLTPGSDETEMNFAWYTQNTSKDQKTKAVTLKLSKKKNMGGAKSYKASQTAATTDTNRTIDDETDDTYYTSNKVTVKNLDAGTTYWYTYTLSNGKMSKPAKFTTGKESGFSFIYVGDPQIGSSNELKGENTEEFYNAQSDSVRSDSFNWNATLNAAMEKSGNSASFVLSAGDQIQTTQKKSPDKRADVSEVEYSGYLSPEILKSLPVATTVGNHDADNANYTYHFNTPNNSELGSNGIVGGDYWFTYDSVLFLMLNTQDTNVAEHKQFIEEAVDLNPQCKWRVVTLHQDIYGSAEHSNEPEITNLRYQLVPYFEEYDIDVVLTGHDHAYSRSKILKGGKSTVEYTDDAFDEQLEKDMDAGENPKTLTTAPGNIKAGTTDPEEQAYLDYLTGIMDADAVKDDASEVVVNPNGILYMTANSSSGSKYYDLVPRKQSYIANRWQKDIPTYSVIDVTDTTFTISTYRTDNGKKIDSTLTLAKVSQNKSGLKKLVASAKKNIVVNKSAYTASSYKTFEKIYKSAKKVVDNKKATSKQIKSAIKALAKAQNSLVKAAPKSGK